MLCKICVKILMRFFHTNFTFTIYFAGAADILEVILGKCIFEKSYINLGNNSVKGQKNTDKPQKVCPLYRKQQKNVRTIPHVSAMVTRMGLEPMLLP